jgi:hypothetical protein
MKKSYRKNCKSKNPFYKLLAFSIPKFPWTMPSNLSRSLWLILSNFCPNRTCFRMHPPLTKGRRTRSKARKKYSQQSFIGKHFTMIHRKNWLSYRFQQIAYFLFHSLLEQLTLLINSRSLSVSLKLYGKFSLLWGLINVFIQRSYWFWTGSIQTISRS